MCLELLCTFTQSSNLKWVSGGELNNPSHQARLLKGILSDELTLALLSHQFIRRLPVT
jgi:hypothetical protein